MKAVFFVFGWKLSFSRQQG